MIHSIQTRLLLTFVCVVAVAIGTIALFSGQATETQFQRYVEENMERERQLRALIESYEQSGDGAALQREVAAIGAEYGDRIILTNREREVVADSAGALLGQTLPPPAGPPGLPPLPPSDRNVLVVPPDVPVDLLVEPVSVSWSLATEPLTAPNFKLPPPAFVFNHAGLGATETGFLGSVRRSLLLGVLAAGAVALLLTFMLSRRIIGPIEALTEAARSLGRGQLKQRVELRSRDELGELAAAFNAMADNLAQTEHLRRTMVTDISHELRTPLSNIRGYLEAFRDGVAEPSEEMIDSLYEEAMLLSRLVDDLQELSLAEAGQLKLDPQPVSVAEVAAKVVAGLQPHLQAKRLTVGLDVPAGLPPIRADAGRFGQIVRNLLHNALVHTPEGGAITLAARPLPGAIEVEVRDSGPGIAPEDLPLIFERFYRADHSRARATGGAGIGLAIVRQLVQAHGGAIEVASELGHGAAFRVVLPQAA
ncbi:MAG TPA: ATP-binding protein [Herpetosiphonaceae bacterium]